MHPATLLFTIGVLASVSLAAVMVPLSSSVKDLAGLPLPTAWPDQHTHEENMYVTVEGLVYTKPVYYDFTNRHLRVDIFLTEIPHLNPSNQSSYWLGDDLYIYNYAPIKNCVHLNMGFGMMRPNWFQGGQQKDTVWFAKKHLNSDGDGGLYHNTLWTQSPVEGQGNFDFFSYVNNTKFGAKAGDSHHFSAPSPLGLVVNEYNRFQARQFVSSDPIFSLPTGIECKNTTITDPLEFVAQHAPFMWHEAHFAQKAFLQERQQAL